VRPTADGATIAPQTAFLSAGISSSATGENVGQPHGGIHQWQATTLDRLRGRSSRAHDGRLSQPSPATDLPSTTGVVDLEEKTSPTRKEVSAGWLDGLDPILIA